QQPTLRGLVQTVKFLPQLSWDRVANTWPPVGTMLTTKPPIWITAHDQPQHHPPNRRMDHVFRHRWTDPNRSFGQIEFIPAVEREKGYRSNPQLRRSTQLGIFTVYPALRRALDTVGPVPLEGGLAKRLNKLEVDSTKGMTSENGHKTVLANGI
ncbi:hypothetical protein BGX27_004332, partial [Mortierella sp. AM989]